MELNRDQFDKLTSQSQQEAKLKKQRQNELKSKWEILSRRTGVAETQSKFPLV